ncbi:MAG: SDR family oxidoreductase [Methanoregulaceae archaeon]|nr:SDR family oxidoreductase [Methanoregulaceae archaeon]
MNPKDLSGKVAIVTGASAGIGLATAKLLAGHGVKVALVSRSKEKLEKISKELPGSLAVPADMTKIPQITRMIKKTKEHFGRIDILVNNAGRGYDAPVEKINVGTFRYIYDLNFTGPLVAMQQVIPIMRSQGGGTIVNISSGTALMHLPDMSAYSSSKRALSGISMAARQEVKDDGIVVSVVYPYITLTDFEKNTIRESPKDNGGQEGATGPFHADTAEYVARRILDGIISGEAEIFSHDWMKNRGNPGA